MTKERPTAHPRSTPPGSVRPADANPTLVALTARVVLLVAVGLSLFPPTALSTIAMRITSVPIPLWQVAVSVSLLILCAGGAVWVAGRAFRLGMLQYGQRLNWRKLFGVKRETSRDPETWRKP